MTGRRAIVGLCMLCALAFSAVAAQSASAANGTTLFTCAKDPEPGGAGFSKEHCREADAVGSGATFTHVAVAQDTTTEVTGTSVNTAGEPVASELHSVQSGIKERLKSNLAHIVDVGGVRSWVANRLDTTTGEHYIEGEGWIEYTEVTVTEPLGKGCVVKGGSVRTNKLILSSKGLNAGPPHQILAKPVPAAAGVFAQFEVEKCAGSEAIEKLNGLYKVEGELKVELDGATVKSTEAGSTAQGTLKLRGQKAGLNGEITVKGTETAVDGVGNDKPLSVTKVTTP